jgi:hypothetical protein
VYGLPRNLFRTVARRVGFDEWRGVNRLDEELFIWNYLLVPGQLAGWRLHRLQRVEAPGWPPTVQSVWAGVNGGLALVDVFECGSREDAHGLLVRLLGQLQSPRVARQEKPYAGDVAFAGPGDGLLVFARANLVLFLRVGDRDTPSVGPPAAQLDAELTSRPETVAGPGVPTILAARAVAPVRRGTTVPLEIAAEDPLGEAMYYKVFSSSGSVTREEGRLLYRHEAAGSPQVELFAVAPGRGAVRRSLTAGE